ncbi:hypothetical protein L6452_35736 [Arctium lappa]|uniref:Uncharacterized protein n=1 Tax=Arctium lappa TaxID=4217 RepID=A0ACB8Y850_ARCLA|nr:hypothetical protein L6452_35736 [Arctium lappa]
MFQREMEQRNGYVKLSEGFDLQKVNCQKELHGYVKLFGVDPVLAKSQKLIKIIERVFLQGYPNRDGEDDYMESLGSYLSSVKRGRENGEGNMHDLVLESRSCSLRDDDPNR